MKKLISVLLALTMIFGCMAHFSLLPEGGLNIIAFAANEDSLLFAINNDEASYRVTGCDKNVSGELTIPDTYNGLPVTYIDSEAFSWCEGLTRVNIGNNVETIGYKAFYKNTGLKTVKIPASVKLIYSDAFAESKMIERIELEDIGKWCEIVFQNHYSNPLVYCYNSFTYYGRYSYLYLNGEPVKDLVIPEGVEVVKYAAFTNYMHLTSITFPSTIKRVEEDAFYGIEDNITGVYVPSLECWLNIDFEAANSNPLYCNTHKYCDSPLYIDNLPLTELSVPESVTEIKQYAFYGYDYLNKLSLHDNIERIGIKAFTYCGFLENEEDRENGILYIDNAIVDVDKNALSGAVVIKEGTSVIADSAFSKDLDITSVSFPDSITTIPEMVFFDCSKLVTVNLSNNTTEIGPQAFYGCSSLEDISLPDSLISIGEYAFYDCTSLLTVDFPESLKEIKNSAFYNSGLTSLKVGGVEEVGGYAFYHCPNLKDVILNNINSVGNAAFSTCPALETVMLSKVKTLGENAFAYCPKLVSVDITDTLKCIDKATFIGDTSLVAIKLPETLEVIGEQAFSELESLEIINMPDSLVSIGNYAFRGCKSLPQIYIGKNVTYIGDYAFDDCVSVNRIEIYAEKIGYPNGLIPFLSCNAAKDVFLHTQAAVDYINLCFTYENVYIGYGVTTIPNYIFNCGSVKTVNIPKSVTKIESYAFNECESLTTIYYGGSPGKWAAITVEDYNDSLYNAEIIFAEHDPVYPDDWMVERVPTCTESGAEYRNCMLCDEHKETRTIPALGHSASEWITDTAATVNSVGSKHKECTVCGDILETSVVSQLKPATPKLTKVANTASGVKVTWGTIEGADNYIVYRKAYNAGTKKWSGWSRLADAVTTASYTDRTAKSGTYYIYTVRAGNEAGLSGYNTSGLKLKFLATPKLASVSNATGKVAVKWNKVSGATGYIVYRKTYNASTKTWSGWSRLATTKSNLHNDTKAKSGTYYRYTVKAYSGDYTSYFDTTGLKIKYLATPSLKSVSSAKNGVTVKWGKVTGATGYIVYRKTGSGDWEKLSVVAGNSKVSYLDKTAKKGKTYRYTVRAYSGTTKSYYNTKGLTIKDKY